MQTFGPNLKQTIKDGDVLAIMLAGLPEASRMTFTQSLEPEILKHLIKNGHELANILAKLPEASRVAFMQILGAETLKQIIKWGGEHGKRVDNFLKQAEGHSCNSSDQRL